MLKKTKAFILKVKKYSESDLILDVLTLEGNKLGLIAKGARKSKKRFSGGVLEPMNLINIVYKSKENLKVEQALFFLNEAVLLQSFDKLRTNYERLELAFYFIKYMDKVSYEANLDADSLFNLLGHSLKKAETTDNLKFLKHCFEMKLLFNLGVLPPKLYNRDILSTAIRDIDELENKKVFSMDMVLSEL
jgi:DNA repair protein RecO (recombination protein O)